MRQRFDVSMAEIGLVLTIRSLAGLGSGMIGGLLTDRLGRKPVMLISLAASGIVLMMFALASSFLQVAVLAAALGLTSPLFSPPLDAMTADLTHPKQRTQAYGMLRVLWLIGGAMVGVSAAGYVLLQRRTRPALKTAP